MIETQTGTGSQGTPEQVVVSSVLKETNEIVLKWPADGFVAKYKMDTLNLNFEPVRGQGVMGYFIGSRLIKLELVSPPEPETKPEPVKPTQNPVKNPPEQKQPEPAGKPWHRTAKVGKIVVNQKNGMVQLNCSYKDFKTVQKPVVTIGGTINLQNYENIRIEISGPFDGQDDITRYIQTLKETALQFGKDEITQGFVRAYVKRTFGE